MPFKIVQNDITQIRVDAIVNAANTYLMEGGGVCGAIFNAAGADELQRACDRLSPIKTGEAVITPGFKLPAKYIIHAVGPVYDEDKAAQCEQLLRSAYLNSLLLAAKNGCTSIAFPLISGGIYGYPKEEAIKVAISAVQTFLTENEMDVLLVFYDEATYAAGEELMGGDG